MNRYLFDELKKEFLDNINSGEKYTHTLFNNPLITFEATYNVSDNNVFLMICLTYPKYSTLSPEGEDDIYRILGRQNLFSGMLDDETKLTIYGIYDLDDIDEDLIKQIEDYLIGGELMEYLKNIDRHTISLIGVKADNVIDMFNDQVDMETINKYLIDIKELSNKMFDDYQTLLNKRN